MKFHIVVFGIEYIKLKFVKIAINPSCRNVFRLLDFFEYLYTGKTTIMFLRLKIVSLWLLNLFDGFFVEMYQDKAVYTCCSGKNFG